MKCFSCHALSFKVFCNKCQNSLLLPTPTMRTVGTLDVVSFYKYSNIENILLTKHTAQGFRIFNSIAKITMKPFIEEFIKNDPRELYILGIDEIVKNGYSHVALLTHAMKLKGVNVVHNALIAQNRVTYAGKSLQYRIENPRNFKYNGKRNIDVILVDDIITTGGTLGQAQSVLIENGVNVLFAVTLADAQE